MSCRPARSIKRLKPIAANTFPYRARPPSSPPLSLVRARGSHLGRFFSHSQSLARHIIAQGFGLSHRVTAVISLLRWHDDDVPCEKSRRLSSYIVKGAEILAVMRRLDYKCIDNNVVDFWALLSYRIISYHIIHIISQEWQPHGIEHCCVMMNIHIIYILIGYIAPALVRLHMYKQASYFFVFLQQCMMVVRLCSV